MASEYSVKNQKLKWEAMKQSITEYVWFSIEDLSKAMDGLCAHNLIRGRGIFCASLLNSQMDSPSDTQPLAALAASVNALFPEVGYLLAKRVLLQITTAHKYGLKDRLSVRLKFLAHLVNYKVINQLLALEILKLLLDNPTDDNVEQAFYFVKECGSSLRRQCPRDLCDILERFCGLLHEGILGTRVQILIEGLMTIRKAKFQGCPAVGPVLDHVKRRDQLTHEISLLEEIESEFLLDTFKPDPQFLENEVQYELKKSRIDEKFDDVAVSYTGVEDAEESDEEEDLKMEINDETEWSMNLRRKIRLAVTSSDNYEEFIIDILNMKVEPGQEMVPCLMILECCDEEKTYNSYYGRIGQWLCVINNLYKESFEKCFVQHYFSVHLFEMKKLTKVACFFAHLLGTKAVSWHILSCIRLTGDEVTPQIRSFLTSLFMELLEHLDRYELQNLLTDPNMQDSFKWIFPRDRLKNTEFCIKFFSLVGLDNVTKHLQEYLNNCRSRDRGLGKISD